LIASIGDLQTLILSPAETATSRSPDRFLMRVANAMQGIGAGATAAADMAALLRQGMLRCQLEHQRAAELRVLRTAGWPTETVWRRFNCIPTPVGAHHLLVRPTAWQPSWLDALACNEVDEATREALRRNFQPIVADPLVTEWAGVSHYVSSGQRAAVHAAFLIPQGSTAIVNLPTGGGKTLAFQLPALSGVAQGGLTVVVVPTVALAKDQEERFRDLSARFNGGLATASFAYHGGLDDQAKSSIRAGIRDGSLPIVFASAEAVMGALRGPLFDAAREGRLRLFAIDEAHIVTQWGQQFRPEFQSIAGLKDALLAECPPDAKFRTLLLTATLTSECSETLRSLFGAGGCQIVAEPSLRLEPSFLVDAVEHEPDRWSKVLESLLHLPRPIILYTTLRDHAEAWYRSLMLAGFRRVRMVRGGDLSDSAGDELLRDWRGQSIDLVVATSAFGLGVDQQEVRSVVHACLPETMDRYYQEVGRAGRDGRAAVAMIVSTAADVATAEMLGKERLIGIDRAFERWDAMWARHRRLNDDSYLLSLDDRPADIADVGPRNASWNLRTLVLMARAGIITFAAHRPPVVERMEHEDEATFETRRRRAIERFSQEVAVRILDPRHLDRRHWDNVVARARSELRAADEQGLRLVRELRNLKRPLNDIFREVYTLDDPPLRPSFIPGSCPVTRAENRASFRCADVDVISITKTSVAISARFEQALGPCLDGVGRAWISYEPTQGDQREQRRWRERLMSLFRFAVAGGITELSLPDGTLSSQEWSQLGATAAAKFLIRAADSDRMVSAPPVPRLTLLDGHGNDATRLERTMMINRPLHVIVAPQFVLHPLHPHRRLFDVTRHSAIEDVLTRLRA
jgi:ATP-dependent DNA helicase RecQ